VRRVCRPVGQDVGNFPVLARFMLSFQLMLWMEMIRLRTTQSQLQGVVSLLLDTIGRATSESGLLRVRMYHSASFQTDMALSLTWDTKSIDRVGSKAGLTISE